MPKRRLNLALALGPVAAAAGAWAGLDALDRRGRRFYATGSSVVAKLDELGAAVLARDLDQVRRSHAAGYLGRPLGLSALAEAAVMAPGAAAAEKDGVRIL